ncbi:MAG: carboxylating nicotinate-nucleotide diphosphorylase, partial [Alphaproteobacteria bacterium]|nr:carboxylating nicotinate-nucleotide diphosphorylase [Alphaproteobacteria bacterium]
MIDPLAIDTVIDAALREDVGFGDLTSELVIPADTQADLVLQTRESVVVAGLEVAAAVFRRRAPSASVELLVPDGAALQAGARLGRIRGPARPLLTAERTALNLLQHLSGIATLTAQYVARIAHTKAVLVDTRKTTPGLRALEKHAVQVGGGRNHRLGLDSGVMIKDNHVALCGGIKQAVARARAGVPLLTKIEVECDRLDQVREALAAGADVIMLDNMDTATMREAVAIVRGKVPLETSGGVNYDTIAGIAETGVDFISVGRITQSAPAV